MLGATAETEVPVFVSAVGKGGAIDPVGGTASLALTAGDAKKPGAFVSRVQNSALFKAFRQIGFRLDENTLLRASYHVPEDVTKHATLHLPRVHKDIQKPLCLSSTVQIHICFRWEDLRRHSSKEGSPLFLSKDGKFVFHPEKLDAWTSSTDQSNNFKPTTKLTPPKPVGSSASEKTTAVSHRAVSSQFITEHDQLWLEVDRTEYDSLSALIKFENHGKLTRKEVKELFEVFEHSVHQLESFIKNSLPIDELDHDQRAARLSSLETVTNKQALLPSIPETDRLVDHKEIVDVLKRTAGKGIIVRMKVLGVKREQFAKRTYKAKAKIAQQRRTTLKNNGKAVLRKRKFEDTKEAASEPEFVQRANVRPLRKIQQKPQDEIYQECESEKSDDDQNDRLDCGRCHNHFKAYELFKCDADNKCQTKFICKDCLDPNRPRKLTAQPKGGFFCSSCQRAGYHKPFPKAVLE